MGVTFDAACESDGQEAPDDGEDLFGEECVYFACGGVVAQNFEALAARDDYLLVLCAGEVAVDGVGDGRGPLQGQIVQMHVI